MSNVIEGYIETIYALERRDGTAHTGDIASLVDVKPASATEMIQKLSEIKLVKYEPYHGVSLTAKGRKMAEELVKRHETLAKFLIILGVDSETANFDACQIEHHVTPKTMKRLTKFVEFIRSYPEKPEWLVRFKDLHKSDEESKK